MFKWVIGCSLSYRMCSIAGLFPLDANSETLLPLQLRQSKVSSDIANVASGQNWPPGRTTASYAPTNVYQFTLSRKKCWLGLNQDAIHLCPFIQDFSKALSRVLFFSYSLTLLGRKLGEIMSYHPPTPTRKLKHRGKIKCLSLSFSRRPWNKNMSANSWFGK